MGEHQSHAMDDSEIDSLLGNGGTGVVSFADGDEPYAIPISYGYDSDEGSIYLRFGFAPDSEKRQFVDDGVTASLVVSDDTGGWRSVIARGPLTSISEPAIQDGATESIHRMNIPYVTIHETPATEMEFEVYRLDPKELTGRKERP
ncbi:pyridoxamine 5'-phosphate oxidase family protein [Halonotius sp. F2-221B]|uniref:pyridoxamine 5'-phosphate oxidase family protein n=1 Tax=Halonotius sp. F2-221B TaxID=2731620 RepID=UPI00398A8234